MGARVRAERYGRGSNGSGGAAGNARERIRDVCARGVRPGSATRSCVCGLRRHEGRGPEPLQEPVHRIRFADSIQRSLTGTHADLRSCRLLCYPCVSPAWIVHGRGIAALCERGSPDALRPTWYAEEVANAALFLASDLTGQITGTELVIDGGNSEDRIMRECHCMGRGRKPE